MCKWQATEKLVWEYCTHLISTDHAELVSLYCCQLLPAARQHVMQGVLGFLSGASPQQCLQVYQTAQADFDQWRSSGLVLVEEPELQRIVWEVGLLDELVRARHKACACTWAACDKTALHSRHAKAAL